ncbi:MAG: alpha/beta hydrolase [Nocardiopsaceae bacterium]|jgi:acetyl esterase/lipase|nr:alpha/beta hydrolase [Nocardiopsaceae bacterium]
MSATWPIEAMPDHGQTSGLPVGYAVAVSLAGLATLAAISARSGAGPFGLIRYLAGFIVNEQPILAGYWLGTATLLAAIQGDLSGPAAWAVGAIAASTAAAQIVLVARSLPAVAVIDKALDDGLGPGWRDGAGGSSARALTPRYERARLLWPLHVRRHDVRRIAGIRYGDAGRANLLDLYRSRHGAAPGELRPVLVHLHGGRLISGHKNREGLPLIYRLASRGWICVSANYRLRPGAQWPDPVVDVKKVITWLRAHGPEYGADPDRIFLAGGSSGAQLASVAALTASDPRFQPGFEDTDTSVRAAISLYGHYGWGDAGPGAPPSSPRAYLRPDAPPFFIAHGDRDTVLPASAARDFAAALRAKSHSAVVYAELPGAQHQFDLFRSLRCNAVSNGIEAFANWVLANHRVAVRPSASSPVIPENQAVSSRRKDQASERGRRPV